MIQLESSVVFALEFGFQTQILSVLSCSRSSVFRWCFFPYPTFITFTVYYEVSFRIMDTSKGKYISLCYIKAQLPRIHLCLTVKSQEVLLVPRIRHLAAAVLGPQWLDGQFSVLEEMVKIGMQCLLGEWNRT